MESGIVVRNYFSEKEIQNTRHEIILNFKDVYECRCCEIFLTKNKTLKFHCSICNAISNNFEDMKTHLTKTHFQNLELKELLIAEDNFNEEYKNDCYQEEYLEDTSMNVEDIIEDQSSDINEDMLGIKKEIDNCSTDEEFEFLSDTSRAADSLYQCSSTTSKAKCRSPLPAKLQKHFQFDSTIKAGKELSNSVEQFNEETLYDNINNTKDISNDEITVKSVENKTNFIHTKKYYCKHCNEAFLMRNKMYAHARSHITEKKFKCDICGTAFKEAFNLRQHKKRHTDEKTLSCSLCTKKFFTRGELRLHEQRHKGARPFMCTVCGLTYATAGLLTEHMKRHTNTRPKKCNVCEKSFYNSAQLNSHMLTHQPEERKHICKFCNVGFQRRKTLVAHIKLHENKKEYKCRICQIGFNQRPALYMHLKKKHDIAQKNEDNSEDK